MRRPSALIAATSVVLALTAAPARADTTSAAEFTAKCSTGTYVVGFDLTVTGAGTLTDDCFIAIGAGVTLGFVNATIDGDGPGCCALVVGDSLEGSRIRVLRSSIVLDGPVQLAAGCCAGGGEPGHPEEHGQTIVLASHVEGTTVEVSGSTAADDGRVVVRRSALTATQSGSFVLSVRASLPGERGEVDVNRSVLTSAGTIDIVTGVDGRTVARNSVLDAAGAVQISTGTGGTCVSSGNTPDVPCT